MKNILSCFLVFIGLSAYAQTDNPKYDKALAESLGGDDYGMKMYVFCILKTGTAKIEDKSKVNELFRGHMENIGRLASEGKLTVAGPLGKNDKNYRGLFIFNVKTIAEAQALLKSDPVVAAGLLEGELYEWYGSAALPEYLKAHEKIEKKKP
ncbi:YciI family protein [Flavobacterium sp. MFBS3-15]|uniref:YciI family protein n=1 Tax=Flavobacterium sp. MFBS3-15 TaxID=2989816 RepID=UPI002235D7A7|nr:YciI family protein [Flavobacterium sp. MFBS3-15]MCW4469070.1 YciI family protein [Flavobacterium sp. MFBS3-15]